MAVMEACGEALVVEPLARPIGSGRAAWWQRGSAAQRAARLPGVIDGSLSWPSPAWSRTAATSWPTADHARRRGRRLGAGRRKGVVFGAPADQLIVSARSSGGRFDEAGIAWCACDARPPASSARCCTVDGQRAADLRFASVQLAASQLLFAPGDGCAPLRDTVHYATRAAVRRSHRRDAVLPTTPRSTT